MKREREKKTVVGTTLGQGRVVGRGQRSIGSGGLFGRRTRELARKEEGMGKSRMSLPPGERCFCNLGRVQVPVTPQASD